MPKDGITATPGLPSSRVGHKRRVGNMGEEEEEEEQEEQEEEREER